MQILLRQESDRRAINEDRFDQLQLVDIADEEPLGILSLQSIGTVDDEQQPLAQTPARDPLLRVSNELIEGGSEVAEVVAHFRANLILVGRIDIDRTLQFHGQLGKPGYATLDLRHAFDARCEVCRTAISQDSLVKPLLQTVKENLIDLDLMLLKGIEESLRLRQHDVAVAQVVDVERVQRVDED